jgi:hypothetical protein
VVKKNSKADSSVSAESKIASQIRPIVRRAESVVPYEETVIRIFFDYDYLDLADLTAIMGNLNFTYDLLRRQARTMPIEIMGRWLTIAIGEGSFSIPRLRIEQIETSHSLEVLCVGAAALVLELAFITKKVFDARKSLWESERAKWEAKKAELEVTHRATLIGTDKSELEAEIQELLTYVQDHININEFQIELGAYLSIEHEKSGSLRRRT